MSSELHLLRLLPGTSPLHRLWAGTKLAAAALLSLALSLVPTWPAIGVVAGTVVLALIVGRIPRGAAPRLPRIFWIGIGMGALLALIGGGGGPHLDRGPIHLAFGGVNDWARFLALVVTLTAAGSIIGWTTPLGEIAPALRRLLTPLRWLRLPVDELTAAVALAVRCLPLLVDELSTLLAVRRLRRGGSKWSEGARTSRRAEGATGEPKAMEPGLRRGGSKWSEGARSSRSSRRDSGSLRARLEEPYDLLAAALVSAVRRATELADAIEARGGLEGAGRVSATAASPGRADALAMVVAIAAATAAIAVG